MPFTEEEKERYQQQLAEAAEYDILLTQSKKCMEVTFWWKFQEKLGAGFGIQHYYLPEQKEQMNSDISEHKSKGKGRVDKLYIPLAHE